MKLSLFLIAPAACAEMVVVKPNLIAEVPPQAPLPLVVVRAEAAGGMVIGLGAWQRLVCPPREVRLRGRVCALTLSAGGSREGEGCHFSDLIPACGSPESVPSFVLFRDGQLLVTCYCNYYEIKASVPYLLYLVAAQASQYLQ